MLAVIAGEGALPACVLEGRPGAVAVHLAGVAATTGDAPVIPARLERLGALFADLTAAGVTQVCLAGAMRRPALDPQAFDPVMEALAPRLMAAMAGGDDALLRLIVAEFETRGFAVLGAHQVAPALLAGPGRLAGPEPTPADLADADRAGAILSALDALDVGQAAVVAGGLCLGIETQQGTDFLLETVARTDPALRRGARGVLVKRPKAGQDLRVDLPAIGPATVAGAARAGLAGIVLAADRVLLLDRARTLAAADAADLFVVAR